MAYSLPRLFLAAALAGSLLSSAAQAADEPEIKDLSLGFGVDVAFAPHVVAIEKGWFTDGGFESISTQSFSAGALAGEALVAGGIHLWTPGKTRPHRDRVLEGLQARRR